MSMSCPTRIEVDRLRREIDTTYDRVARRPQDSFHFNTGLDYACELLRYRRDELEAHRKFKRGFSPSVEREGRVAVFQRPLSVG